MNNDLEIAHNIFYQAWAPCGEILITLFFNVLWSVIAGDSVFAYIFCQKCKTQLLTHTMHNCKSHLAMN